MCCCAVLPLLLCTAIFRAAMWWSKTVSRGLSTFRADEKGRSIMMSLLSCGRQRRSIPIVSVRNCWRSISMPCANISLSTSPISIVSFVILFFSARCKCSELTVSGGILRRNLILSRVFLLLSRTCVTCSKRRTLNTRIFAMCYANLPNSSNSPTISRNGSLPSKWWVLLIRKGFPMILPVMAAVMSLTAVPWIIPVSTNATNLSRDWTNRWSVFSKKMVKFSVSSTLSMRW